MSNNDGTGRLGRGSNCNETAQSDRAGGNGTGRDKYGRKTGNRRNNKKKK